MCHRETHTSDHPDKDGTAPSPRQRLPGFWAHLCDLRGPCLASAAWCPWKDFSCNMRRLPREALEIQPFFKLQKKFSFADHLLLSNVQITNKKFQIPLCKPSYKQLLYRPKWKSFPFEDSLSSAWLEEIRAGWGELPSRCPEHWVHTQITTGSQTRACLWTCPFLYLDPLLARYLCSGQSPRSAYVCLWNP